MASPTPPSDGFPLLDGYAYGLTGVPIRIPRLSDYQSPAAPSEPPPSVSSSSLGAAPSGPIAAPPTYVTNNHTDEVIEWKRAAFIIAEIIVGGGALVGIALAIHFRSHLKLPKVLLITGVCTPILITVSAIGLYIFINEDAKTRLYHVSHREQVPSEERQAEMQEERARKTNEIIVGNIPSLSSEREHLVDASQINAFHAVCVTGEIVTSVSAAVKTLGGDSSQGAFISKLLTVLKNQFDKGLYPKNLSPSDIQRVKQLKGKLVKDVEQIIYRTNALMKMYFEEDIELADEHKVQIINILLSRMPNEVLIDPDLVKELTTKARLPDDSGDDSGNIALRAVVLAPGARPEFIFTPMNLAIKVAQSDFFIDTLFLEQLAQFTQGKPPHFLVQGVIKDLRLARRNFDHEMLTDRNAEREFRQICTDQGFRSFLPDPDPDASPSILSAIKGGVYNPQLFATFTNTREPQNTLLKAYYAYMVSKGTPLLPCVLHLLTENEVVDGKTYQAVPRDGTVARGGASSSSTSASSEKRFFVKIEGKKFTAFHLVHPPPPTLSSALD